MLKRYINRDFRYFIFGIKISKMFGSLMVSFCSIFSKFECGWINSIIVENEK